ncbi:MAG: hypothetical protein ACRETE_06340 [Stenotrophobium sp.]
MPASFAVMLLGAIGLAAAPSALAASGPPVFGLASVATDQTLHLHLTCYEHPDVIGYPPTNCSGLLMVHDDQGSTLVRHRVSIRPGQSVTLDYEPAPTGDHNGQDPPPSGDRQSGIRGINPCWLPDPGSGIGIPTVEISDTHTGRVVQYLGFEAQWNGRCT